MLVVKQPARIDVASLSCSWEHTKEDNSLHMDRHPWQHHNLTQSQQEFKEGSANPGVHRQHHTGGIQMDGTPGGETKAPNRNYRQHVHGWGWVALVLRASAQQTL